MTGVELVDIHSLILIENVVMTSIDSVSQFSERDEQIVTLIHQLVPIYLSVLMAF